MFNRALWRKTVGESLILLLPVAIVVAGFSWLFVYLTNNMAIAKLPALLKYILPTHLLQLNSMRLEDWGTRQGVLSAIYIHPVVEFACIIWALVRGSAAVSGEISRGTMEMLLAQPIARWSLIVVNGVTAALGAMLLPAATIVGLAVGVAMFPPRVEDPHEAETVLASSSPSKSNGVGGLLGKVAEGIFAPLTGAQTPKAPAPEPKTDVRFFFPAAALLAAYTFCLCGVCTLVSSWDHYRFRTIGTIGVWGVLQVVFDVVARWVKADNPLVNVKWLTIKTCFEPQRVLFCEPGQTAVLLTQYCSVFVAIGLVAYIAAAVVFSKRDLPTPL